MKKATILVALPLISLPFILADLEGQESTQSLGELARQQRARKQTTFQVANPTKDLKLSPEEKVAYLNVGSTITAELRCKEVLGKYVAWEQLVEDCGPSATSATVKKENDPRRDPNYDYRLTADQNTLALSAVPRQAGRGGFFSDGRRIYFNPQGEASRDSTVVWDFSSPASTQLGGEPAYAAILHPPQAGAHNRKVYTEEDLQALGGAINIGGQSTNAATTSGEVSSSGQSSPSPRNPGKDIKLSREEACGTVKINNIVAFERMFCGYTSIPSAKRSFCSLEELEPKVVEKLRASGEAVTAADSNLRSDTNYEYRLIERGDRLDVVAAPRRSGLGAFYCHNAGIYGEEQCYYNAQGEASIQDTPLSESSMSGGGCFQ